MQLTLCCCCNDGDKGKYPNNVAPEVGVIEAQSPATVPVVLEQPKAVETIQLEQPKATETIQLDRINDEPSEAPIEVDEKPVAAPRKSIEKTYDEPPPKPCDPLTHEQFVQQNKPPPSKPYPLSNLRPSWSYVSSIGDEVLKCARVAPGIFMGTFKDSQFTILNGQFHSKDGIYTGQEKETILTIHSRAIHGMEQGLKGMQGGMGLQEVPPPGSAININYTTKTGEPAVMTFRVVEPGHYKTSYNGKQFSIINRRVITTDGADDEDDKALVLTNYYMAMLSMEQGLLGMQQGMLGMQAGLVGMNAGFMSMNAVRPSPDVLATGQDTLRRMRSLNARKRISILEGGLTAQPRPPVKLNRNIDERSYTPSAPDEVDGLQVSTIPEPALRKTTFEPNAVIYQDPKTYEPLDKDELPNAKRLDEYIISMDETVKSGDRYYFHSAKPKRVIRKPLGSEEKLHIASADRYSLFEIQSVKAHNEFRKMHGVPPLVNNEFLCEVAREWAEHLALKDAFYHRPKNEYGENLYYADGMPICAKKAVKAWYDEIDLYDYDNPKFSKETGHFTQLVWKDTREMGTGVAQIGDKVWVCCNYHPPGNFLDKFNDEYIPRPVIKPVKRY